MRTRFIANFQGTRDRPPAMSDLHRVKQQPGETLQKFIQRFNSARVKIPRCLRRPSSQPSPTVYVTSR